MDKKIRKEASQSHEENHKYKGMGLTEELQEHGKIDEEISLSN